MMIFMVSELPRWYETPYCASGNDRYKTFVCPVTVFIYRTLSSGSILNYSINQHRHATEQ